MYARTLVLALLLSACEQQPQAHQPVRAGPVIIGPLVDEEPEAEQLLAPPGRLWLLSEL